MKLKEVMAALESFGSEQTRKTYRRHGVEGPLLGVKYGDLNKLVRRIKVDHSLALELWATGVHDARVLATMVAEPAKVNLTTLNAWIKDVDYHVLSSTLSNIAQRSPVAVRVMRKWMGSRKELVAHTGWMMLAGIARESPETFTETEYKAFLKTIGSEIYGAPNRVRHAMNTALISIGSHVDEKNALVVSRRIGIIEVDHGDTSCKTPVATSAITKAAAKQRARE